MEIKIHKNTNTNSKKNLILLSISQAIFVSATIISFTFAGLVGKIFSENPVNATLPIVFTGMGTLFSLFPASLLMKKKGRKFGFLVGCFFGFICGTLSYIAIQINSFLLFCISCSFMGVYQAFALYLRFAAAEVVSKSYASRAISTVLVGGVLGAIIGPELSTLGNQIVPMKNYGQSYLIVASISLIGFIISIFLEIPKQVGTYNLQIHRKKKLLTIISDKFFSIAVINICIAYFLMILLMTATPLAMINLNFNLTQINRIIQWHLLGMYLPSFFTGHLIFKYGVRKIFLVGLGLLTISCVTVYSGTSFEDFALALIAIGVGWNFVYISGSTLITTIGNPIEAPVIQAANEFIICLVSASASYFAGLLLYLGGWQKMSMCGIPFIILAAVITSYLNTNEENKISDFPKEEL